VLVNH